MPLKTHHDEQPTINLTPMIDIVFLLIIFFMVGTKFTEMERKITITVPQVRHAGALSAAPTRRVISIKKDGQIALDEQIQPIQEIAAQLQTAREEYADLGVVIRGDEEVAFRSVAQVLSVCQAAGIDEMAISVRMAGGKLR